MIHSFFNIYFASDKKYYYSCENSKKYIYAKCDYTQKCVCGTNSCKCFCFYL